MFGVIIPSWENLSLDERNRYQSVYCGLCHSIRKRYSNLSRLALSYDLTFLVLLLQSLYEPSETESECTCIFHPGKKINIRQSEISDYCADLTVCFAYHKIKDDINDEGSIKSKIEEKLLYNQYQICKKRIPELCKITEEYMKKICILEAEVNKNFDNHLALEAGDTIAKYFGYILAKVFCLKNDIWSETLSVLGANLGRFIYFMDAIIDLRNDRLKDTFNPYINIYNDNDLQDRNNLEFIKNQLSVLLGEFSLYFEKLPLEQDLHLLKNIIYEGSWISFNHNYKDVKY